MSKDKHKKCEKCKKPAPNSKNYGLCNTRYFCDVCLEERKRPSLETLEDLQQKCERSNCDSMMKAVFGPILEGIIEDKKEAEKKEHAKEVLEELRKIPIKFV